MTTHELSQGTIGSVSTTRQRAGTPARDVRASLAEIRANIGALARPAGVAGAWGWALVATQMLFVASVLFEPVPANPKTSTLDDILGFGTLGVFLVGYGWAMTRTFRGDRRGLVWSLPVTALMLVMAVSCPVSGHHAWGLWVVGSFATAIAACVVHLGAVRVSRPSLLADKPPAL